MNKGEEDWVNAMQGMNAAETGLQPKGRQHSRCPRGLTGTHTRARKSHHQFQGRMTRRRGKNNQK